MSSYNFSTLTDGSTAIVFDVLYGFDFFGYSDD